MKINGGKITLNRILFSRRVKLNFAPSYEQFGAPSVFQEETIQSLYRYSQLSADVFVHKEMVINYEFEVVIQNGASACCLLRIFICVSVNT